MEIKKKLKCSPSRHQNLVQNLPKPIEYQRQESDIKESRSDHHTAESSYSSHLKDNTEK